MLEGREDGRKRNHKHAMQESHRLCETMKKKLASLDKEAERLRWERRKHNTTVAMEKEAVDIAKWGVQRAKKKVARKAEAVTRREEMVIGEEDALCQKQAEVVFQRQVKHLCTF